MSQLSRFIPRLWPLVLICSIGFLFWCDRVRWQRVEYVSGLVTHAAPVAPAEADPLTGRADGQRELIVPGRNERSFDWIAQTQQMFAKGEGRVRSVAYDNAPEGRAVDSPSPYRWWLGLLAYIDHGFSGRPIGLSVEHVALWADPVLHLLLLVGGTCFVAWQFGGVAAALFSVGIVALFPFAGEFLPGMPDDRGLSQTLLVASLLVMLAAIRSSGVTAEVTKKETQASSRGPGMFMLAGILGGLAVWVNLPAFAPLVLGIFAGGLWAEWSNRRQPGAAGNSCFPWRAWALSGGTTLLVAYLAEYFPDHMEFRRLEILNPVYGLAWIAMGEVMTFVAKRFRSGDFPSKLHERLAVVAAILLSVTIPLAMWKTGSAGIFVQATTSARLTPLPNTAFAPNLWAWLSRDGASALVWATLLPMLILVPAGWCLIRSTDKMNSGAVLAVVLGPAVLLVGFGCSQLGMWSSLGGALLVLVVAIATQPRGAVRAGVVSLAMIAGIFQLLPSKFQGGQTTLTAFESQELIERHLAHWLAKRSGEQGVMVYAPPHVTTTLCFYGSLRGIGTFAAENRAGFGTTLMIAGMNTMEEAQGLLTARGVRYIVVPSWDPFFDEFAQRYLAKNYSNRSSLLVRELRQWNLPPWLRAVPYQIPVGGGFEGQSVLVFELVDEQSPTVAAGRLAEYLVEVGELDRAAITAETLRRFPGDVGALVARAQVQAARQDGGGFAQTLTTLQTRLSAGADRFLPWDRRVSLAIVLAKADQAELSREQLRRCLSEINEAKLRSLTTASLYGLQVLTKAFELNITDAHLRELALELLPEDLRERI